MKIFCLRAAIPVLFLVTTLNADTLVLRNGRRVEGQLVSVRGSVVEFDEGRSFNRRIVTFDRDDVVSIEFDRNDRNNDRFDRNDSRQNSQTSQNRRSGLRERQLWVVANQQWVDTNIDIRSGQEVYFEATGDVRWGPGRRDGPGGEQNSPNNPYRPMPNRPAAAMIGRVGSNSSDYFFIGDDRGPIRMRNSGRLFLGINDDNLQDNSGTFRVIVYY